MDWLKKLASLLVIIGALNWGLVGLFGFNLVTEIFGSASTLTKVVYTLVGVSGLWMAVDLFKK
ncbi:DUF378 domain-containing protein [Fictibacillus aquaticus]|jgi:uncharacterized membrane protein YuzA (DUF378 family)|uniref:DUF378 domain-containing protein n=1 Tax=Fictibacillus aquaticus TaxID=2021314 RepID=A0A235FC15_9BACL|nr:DUF378 domain-containing protein [Fictibacillus aquaticus]OYD58739.1 DUF378 domain-containing protein [Fictibacillus aquaticus]